DANEEGSLNVTLTNRGQGAAYGVEVALSYVEVRRPFDDPSATLRQPFDPPAGGLRVTLQGNVTGVAPGLSFPAGRYVGEIPPGKSRQVSIPLKAGLELPTGRVTLTVSFTEANGFEPDPIEITFDTRAFAPPELAVADVGVDEPSGNGMIEAGEVVTVMVRVQNRGQGTAEETKARVNIGKNVFTAAGSATEFDLGTLSPGTFRDIEFQIYTNRRAKDIPVTVTLTERHGKYGLADAPLDLPFNQPVRSVQQVIVEGRAGEVAGAGAVAGGLSIDIERDIPQGRDRRTDAVALIIANRHYQDPDIPAVTFAHRDGEFMRQYLIKTLGYREGNIFVYRDATQSNFRTALRKLGNAAKAKADVFVYYTGHGAPDPEEKRGYFVPVDCDPNYVQLGGVGLDEFYDTLRDIPARTMTVVIDACFSGASDQGMIIRNISPIMLVVESEARLGDRAVAFTSSASQEVSSWYPEKKHSLYTYYFLKGLQGAADQNQDETLTAGELQNYLEDNVPYMARRLNNRQQTPEVTPGREDRVLVRYKR
ncbi:MAG: caspase family protein, partial [Candidatus Marinimicrobia bacterium]|nr:caspase family protein [Candidatus Neomarinimicrobiota bacterium]